MPEETAVAGDRLGAEAVELLSELIRFDTANPPGNEGPAQEMLAARLAEAGFQCTMLARDPGRPNLVARLAGEAPGQTLGLLGHVDTVPADAAEWSFDPCCGEVVDGAVRGRGAQDMKDQVAAEVAAAIGLAGEGWRPARGELKLILTADEERGAEQGAAWLCAEHPEVVRCDLVVNEGGGGLFEVGERRYYALCVGEKGINRFLLRARGTAGHASVPGYGDNALLKLGPALTRLRSQPPLEPTPAGVAFLAAVLGADQAGSDPAALDAAVERLRTVAPQLAAFLVEPMLRVTLAPTRARASEKTNVIPSRAELLVDCRVPPGGGEAEAREAVAAVLGPLASEYELEFTERTVGNSSPAETPLAGAIADWLAEADPGAALVPIVFAGFSDSHWFREAFDATVYGFCPKREFDLFRSGQLMHGADERAAVSDVELAADFYSYLCRRVLG